MAAHIIIYYILPGRLKNKNKIVRIQALEPQNESNPPFRPSLCVWDLPFKNLSSGWRESPKYTMQHMLLNLLLLLLLARGNRGAKQRKAFKGGNCH